MPGTQLTKVELYGTRSGAIGRMRALQLAGYRAYSVDSKVGVAVYISPGKHSDLSQLPAPATPRPP